MKKAFIVGVLLILLFPTVWMFAVKTQPMIIEENRIREQRYAFKKAYTALFDNGEYCGQFSKWFNDHYGMRDVMIRTKNQIDYSVFGLANGVYIGDEGYLVYENTVLEQSRYLKIDDHYLDVLIVAFEHVRNMLEEKGIEFYIMIPPLKNTVFPERFENIPAKYPEVTKYDYFMKMLSENFPDNFIDVRDILVEAEKKAPVYYKTDFHWNNHGGNAAFSLLANKIAGETIFTLDDYSIATYDGFKGTQLNNFSILQDITETGYSAMGTSDSVITDTHLVKGSLHMANTKEAKLGRLLILGDSYSNYITKYNGGVADCFSEIHFVNMNDHPYDGLLAAISKENVDYVLFENIEIAIVTFLNKLERMARE